MDPDLDDYSNMGVVWVPSLEQALSLSIAIGFTGLAIVLLHLALRRRSHPLPDPLWIGGTVALIIGGLAAALMIPLGTWFGHL